MLNLLRSDLYRMKKAKSFYFDMLLMVALIVSWPFIEWGFIEASLALNVDGVEAIVSSFSLSFIISNPVATILPFLLLLSVMSFTYADMANGYIKNIAGHVKKKSVTIISKFIAVGVHNLILMVVSVIAMFLAYGLRALMLGGTIDFTSDIGEAIIVFFLKGILLQALSTIILFMTSAIRSKAAAAALSVALGMSILQGILYLAVESLMKVTISDMMPDSLLSLIGISNLSQYGVNALVSGIVTIALFLYLSMKLVDRRDVK